MPGSAPCISAVAGKNPENRFFSNRFEDSAAQRSPEHSDGQNKIMKHTASARNAQKGLKLKSGGLGGLLKDKTKKEKAEVKLEVPPL